MGFLGKSIDTARVEAQMADAMRQASMGVPADSTFLDDLKNLRASYKEHDYAHALGKFQNILQKWDKKFKPQGRAKLLKTMGAIAVSESNFNEAQSFFDQALTMTPDNESILIEKAECHMAEGDILSAKDCFRKSFIKTQNVHTASKYAEILYLTGEAKENIQAIIKPFLGSSLNAIEAKRSEVVILALHLLHQSDDDKRRDYFAYIRSHSKHQNPDVVLKNLRSVIEAWTVLDRDEVMQDRALSRYQGRFNVNASAGLLQEPTNDDQEILDPITQKILKAYKAANDVFNDSYSRRPASNQVVRAAGGRGPNWS